MGSRTNIGKVRAKYQCCDAQGRAEVFRSAVRKAVRRTHFCGHTGGSVLAKHVVGLFLASTVGQVTCCCSQRVGAVTLPCLGLTSLKVSQGAGGSGCSLICSRSTRLCCWMSLQLYTNETLQVPRRQKPWPKARFGVGNSQFWFWDYGDLLTVLP